MNEHKCKMELEDVAKLIVMYCEADHISEGRKYRFVLEALEKAQEVVIDKMKEKAE